MSHALFALWRVVACGSIDLPHHDDLLVTRPPDRWEWTSSQRDCRCCHMRVSSNCCVPTTPVLEKKITGSIKDWLSDRLLPWLINWLIYRLNGLLIYWLIDWLIDWYRLMIAPRVQSLIGTKIHLLPVGILPCLTLCQLTRRRKGDHRYHTHFSTNWSSRT